MKNSNKKVLQISLLSLSIAFGGANADPIAISREMFGENFCSNPLFRLTENVVRTTAAAGAGTTSSSMENAQESENCSRAENETVAQNPQAQAEAELRDKVNHLKDVLTQAKADIEKKISDAQKKLDEQNQKRARRASKMPSFLKKIKENMAKPLENPQIGEARASLHQIDMLLSLLESISNDLESRVLLNTDVLNIESEIAGKSNLLAKLSNDLRILNNRKNQLQQEPDVIEFANSVKSNSALTAEERKTALVNYLQCKFRELNGDISSKTARLQTLQSEIASLEEQKAAQSASFDINSLNARLQSGVNSNMSTVMSTISALNPDLSLFRRLTGKVSMANDCRRTAVKALKETAEQFNDQANFQILKELDRSFDLSIPRQIALSIVSTLAFITSIGSDQDTYQKSFLGRLQADLENLDKPASETFTQYTAEVFNGLTSRFLGRI